MGVACECRGERDCEKQMLRRPPPEEARSNECKNEDVLQQYAEPGNIGSLRGCRKRTRCCRGRLSQTAISPWFPVIRVEVE